MIGAVQQLGEENQQPHSPGPEHGKRRTGEKKIYADAQYPQEGFELFPFGEEGEGGKQSGGDGKVQAGQRQNVGKARPAEGLLRLPGEAGAFSQKDGGQQSAVLSGEGIGDGAGEPLPEEGGAGLRQELLALGKIPIY